MLTWWVVLAACAAATAACPLHCSCFTDPDGFKSGNCSTRALGGVQPSSLDLLSFQPHDPGYSTRLAPRAFIAFKRVTYLWVVNCSVLNLPNGVFQGLDRVLKIDLSYNKIRNLNGAVFKSLRSLHTLLLRGNPLLLTPWDVIVSDSLQELDLGHCGLRTIPQGTFITAPRLSRLYLDGNEIHTFTFNMIPAGLRYLNLARNRIVRVPTDVLITMTYLTKLDLSKNPIKCNCNLLIMQDWFSGQGIIFENGVTCAEPSQYTGQRLNSINENELCTLEEVKRQRRINDIESYRDSKAHRTNNMIHDPDLQADQPNEELLFDAERIFDDKETPSLTHMELSKQHYPLPSDLSDENNKLAASKQDLAPTELDLASPTKAEPVKAEETNQEIADLLVDPLSTVNSTEISDEISTEDLAITHHELIPKIPTAESHTKTFSDNFTTIQNIPSNVTTDLLLPANDTELSLIEAIPTNSPENDMTDEGYSPLYTSTPHSKLNHADHTLNNVSVLDQLLSDEAYNPTQNVTGSNIEMADEGFSPVSNTSDITFDDPGSGDGDLEYHNETHSTISALDATSSPFNWSTSHSDTGDYSYDTQHDYSGETGPTTEAMSTTYDDEGSGAGAFEELSSSLPPYINDDNETSTDGYITVESSTDTSQSYSPISSSYSSSPEPTYSPSENVTDEEPTTELVTEVFDSSSSESPYIPSSSEATESSSSSTSDVYVPIIVSSTEMTSTSESPSSSTSEGPIIPIVDVDQPSTEHPEIVTGSSSTSAEIPEVQPTTMRPVNEVEVISRKSKENEKGKMMVEPTQAAKEEGRTAAAQSTLTYVIIGLLVALILLVITTVLCRKMSKMGPCTSKKKVRLPQDTEATLGTEMQDMLLPKPPENGVKIIPQNGTPNGKEVKEEEIPVLQKDWDEKPEPIETVTARMSILAGPQTPVFIHKTLA